MSRHQYAPAKLVHTSQSHTQRKTCLLLLDPQILWSLHRFGFLQASPSAGGAAANGGGGGSAAAADAEFRAAAAAAVAAALAAAPQRGAAAAVGCGAADVASLLLWAVRTGTAPAPEAVQVRT